MNDLALAAIDLALASIGVVGLALTDGVADPWADPLLDEAAAPPAGSLE